MSSPNASGSQPTVRRSVRTRLLALLLGLTTLSVLIVGYLGVNSVQSFGRSARETSAGALRTQAEDYLRQLTTSEAQRNDLILQRVQRDAQNAAEYAAHLFDNPNAFAGEAYWEAEEHMFVGSEGQYMNPETDTSSVFVPNYVDVDEELLDTLELSAHMDSLFTQMHASDPNTVAIYLGTEQEVTRYYPNINLGGVIPADFQVTQRPWYTNAAPENNPDRTAVWTSAYVDATGQGLMVTASAPVYTDRDEFQGAVGIDVTLQDISASVERTRLLGSGYSFLVDDTGRAIALPDQGYQDILGRPPQSDEIGPDLSESTTAFAPILSKMTTGASGFHTLEIDGRKLFVAYAPLESTGWSLANVIEEEAVLQAMASLRSELETSTRSLVLTRILPVGGGILILMAAIGLLLAYRLSNPIRKMAAAAERIGAGEWDAPLPAAQDHEIGVLADAFKHMTSHLREIYAELEERVAERTRDLKRHAVQLEAAAEVARNAAAIRDVDQLLNATVHLISDQFGFYHTGVFLLDGSEEYAVLRATSSAGGQRMLARGHKLGVGKVGIVGNVAGSGKPRVALDVGQDAVFFDNPDLPETRSEIALPLEARGDVIGVLDVQSQEPAAFSDEDVAILQTLADQVALAIDNARLLERSRRTLRELEVVYGEQARSAWEALENLPAFAYDRVDVTPTSPQLSSPIVEQAISARKAIAASKSDNGGSALVAPLRLRDQVIGAISLEELDETRSWTEEEIELVEAVSDQIALALESAHLFEEARTRAEELSVLNELGQTLTTRLNVEDVLTQTHRGVSRLFKTNNFYVALYDPETNEVSFPLAIEKGERVEWQSRQMGNGLTEHVIRNRTAVRIQGDFHEWAAAEGIDVIGEVAQSWLGVPLMTGDQVLGVMAVQSYDTPRLYSERDQNLLASIANQTAIALQNALLFEQTQEALAETESLYAGSDRVSRAETLKEILQALVDSTALQRLDRTTLLLFDSPIRPQQQPESFTVSGTWEHSGEESAAPVGTRYEFDQFPAARMINRDQPTIVTDVTTDERFDEATQQLFLDRLNMRSAFFWPLTVGDQWIGVISGQASTSQILTEDEIRQISTLIDQAASVVQSIRLLEESQRRATQLAAAAEVARDATAILDVDQLLDETVHLISEQFGFYHAGVFLLDEDGQYATLRAASSTGGKRMLERGHKLKVGEVGIVGFVTSAGKSRIALDVGEDAVHFANPDLPNTRSELAVPLIARGEVIGALDVQSTEETAFTDEDVSVLRTMADQLVTAIQNARLFSETEEALTETREMFQASQSIGAATTPSDVGKVLTDYVSGTGLDVARLLMYDLTADEPTHVVMTEGWSVDERPLHPYGTRLRVRDFALTQFIDPDQAVAIDDIHSDPRVDEAVQVVMEVVRLRSFAIIPLTVGGRAIGGLMVGRDVPYTYPEKLIRNLWTLCGQAAIAIENLRLLEETRHRVQQLEAINDVGRTITSVLDPDILVRQIVDVTKARFEHFFTNIFLVEDDRLVFEEGSTIGHSDHRLDPRSISFAINQPGILTEAARSGEPILVGEVTSDPRYTTVAALSDTRSELAVPIEVKGEIIGVLDVQSDEAFAYDETDMLLLQSLASQAGVAIENARLFAEMEGEAQRRALISEMLQAASTSLDPEDLLHRAGEAISRRLTIPTVVYLWHPEQETLRLVAAHASDATDVPWPGRKRMTSEMDPTLMEVVQTRGTRILESISGRLSGPAAALADRLGTQAALYVPLVSRGQVLGVLQICRTGVQAALGPQDVGFTEIVAANLSVALENARLYQEAVQTAERLAEVDRLKSQFLANMSHELRTPLNSIIGFSRVILKGIDGPLTDLQQQDLQAIYNSGQHLLGLINDILDISKIEAGKVELTFEDTDLSEIIEGVMSTAVALVKDKPVDLQKEIPDDLPIIQADGRRIRQVLLNLVSNAAKFTDEGFIRVSAERDDEFVTVSVSDSGIGIPSEKLENIFEAFTQVDSSSSRKYGGTGLGLTITKSFIDLHGGDIWVESEVGEGSTFAFKLPIEGPPSELQEAEERETEPAPEEQTEKSDRLVLCVDDDEGVLTLFRRYLRKQGYQVTGLTDSRRALEEAKRLQPYAITLDVMMPEKDGWKVIQELKSDPETSHIPVIMCTIVGEKGRGISLGAADYLVKPILEQDLLRALDRLDREDGRHRVLVVDDQAKDRNLLRRMIESQEGYDVIEAAGGQEAISLLRQTWPHIIVLDLLMPGVDGFAVLEAVKANEATRSIPIIVVTGKDLTEEDFRKLNQHTEALIQKGVLNQQELLEDVAAALQKVDYNSSQQAASQ